MRSSGKNGGSLHKKRTQHAKITFTQFATWQTCSGRGTGYVLHVTFLRPPPDGKLTSFEASKLAADGRPVTSFMSRFSVRRVLLIQRVCHRKTERQRGQAVRQGLKGGGFPDGGNACFV